MAGTTTRVGALLRYSPWDAIFVVLAVMHGAILLAFPTLAVVAVGVWWNSNTISHNFIHKPFFRSAPLNDLFRLYLTVILGIPQSVWKARHLAHHADLPWRLRITSCTVVEFLLVAALWTLLAVVSPRFFLTVYLPGYTIGLALCYVHGYFEHWNGTISHYGWMYNWLFFNDGYHVEHHESPGTHWTWLPRGVAPGARTSRWPAILRWLDYCSLDSLERVVLHSRTLQRFVLACHERAFQHLLPDEPITSIAIVGGGLFPRTALILRRLLPDARLVVIDASPENLRSAERHLPSAIECVEGFYDPELHRGFDMVVLPLALVGDRDQYYRTPTAPYMLIHDWLWRPHGQSAIVSCLLMKRLNRISGSEAVPQNFTEQSVRLCRY